MSDAVEKTRKDLSTEEKRIRLCELIMKTWTPPQGGGHQAERKIRLLIEEIIRRYQLARPIEIYWVVANSVSSNCDKSFSAHFKRLVQEEYDRAVEDGSLQMSSQEKSRYREKRRKALWADKQASALLTKKLADSLKCTIRYAAMLRKDGTTNAAVAKQMADVLGTAVKDHLRARLRTGRQLDLPALFLRLWLPGASFRDFLEDESLVLPANVEALAATLREQRGDHRIRLAEIGSLEDLIHAFISFEITKKPPACSVDLWAEFKLWKIELVATLATRMVKENVRTDNAQPRYAGRREIGF